MTVEIKLTPKASQIVEWFERRKNAPADWVDVSLGIDRGNIAPALSELFDAGVLEKIEGKNKMCMRLTNYPPGGREALCTH